MHEGTSMSLGLGAASPFPQPTPPAKSNAGTRAERRFALPGRPRLEGEMGRGSRRRGLNTAVGVKGVALHLVPSLERGVRGNRDTLLSNDSRDSDALAYGFSGPSDCSTGIFPVSLVSR
ncbi:hypothetical protein BN1708_003642 [Verticillium longisporum]|uniref:Uncharacterized protein n=1 Tax=Verticillium longisporum TaxID=100787 RepID=A0A0G4LNW0_VERLO|nr:hypothetical protein BN1708_003642 [Verticillium longisporum]